jgi:hypothetical protein
MISSGGLESWFASIVGMLLLGILIVGFSTCVGLLISWIWGREREVVEMPRMNRPSQEPPFRQAA